MNSKHNPPLVLIADDQKPATDMLERVFEYEGYQASSVHDGIAAVKAAQVLLPDLLLLDINMPGLNGFEVLKHLRENPRTASIPTILITAMDELSNVVQGLELGADDYLRKPFHPQELLARAQSKMRARQLEEALQRRTQELEALLRVSEELSQHIDMAELLEIILYLVADLLPCKVSIICYFGETGRITEYRVHYKDESPQHPAIVPKLLQKIVSDNLLSWEKTRTLFPDYSYGIIMPIQHGVSTRGMLAVMNDDDPYDKNHMRLLEAISRQAALALRNAELYEIQTRYALHLEDMVAERTAELESAQKMLIRSEKLASIGRLAASVAHEINNPLLPIQINLEDMLEDVKTRQNIDVNDIHKTLESVERIKQITSRLLGFTGNQQADNANFHFLNINDVLHNIVELNRKFFQQQSMSIDMSLGQLPDIWGNKYQLEHVFMNLVLNAKDAMRTGGVLTITSGVEADDVVITVEDTGCGIAPEMIDTIFEPFVSTKETGNGLGLFISYGIIQSHQGTITVKSAIDHGTRFTLRFPVARVQQSPPL